MNLKELGETFRLERERKGLTIDDVIQRTKISKSNVLALESGEATKLPHPVYAKGFVRNYARLLGLDPEECALVMAGEYMAIDNVGANPPVADATEPELGEGSGSKSGLLVFMVGVLAIALLAGLMFYMNSSKDKDGAENAVPAVEQSASAEAQPGPPAVEALNPPEQASVENVLGQHDAEQGAQAPEAPVDAQPKAVEQAAKATAQTKAALGADGRSQLLVAASEACWIYAKVDGGDDVDGGVTVDVVLQPGESKQLHFRKEMVMRLGNAGGVSVKFNGELYPFEAQSGQVKTLTFTAP